MRLLFKLFDKNIFQSMQNITSVNLEQPSKI